MSTLYLTVGLPGSGKSTYAKRWVALDPSTRFRLNRDCFRDMGRPGCYTPGAEIAVTVAIHGAARDLLLTGYDVICDDTNLRPEVVDEWRSLAIDAGADMEVVDFTLVPVDVCIERDAGRPDRGYPPTRWDGARVGAEVIRGMAGRYLGVDGMVTA